MPALFSKIRLIAAACALAHAAGPAFADAKFPERPIRVVVPFGAGGGTDVVARRFVIKFSQLLGQQAVVDNKGGANGVIGTTEITRARPDGYNLLMGTVSTHSINPITVKNLSYDPIKDFAPVAVITTVPLAIAVHPSGATNLKDLIERIRANPGKFSYGTPGVGSLNNITGEIFKKRLGGLDMMHVPYKGGGQSIQDLMANQIPVIFETFSSVLALHREKRIRILAVFNDKRASAAPDVPTAAEAGVPGISVYTYNALFAPAGTPPAVIDTLYQATRKVVEDDAFQKSLSGEAVEIVTDSNPGNAKQFMLTEQEKWKGYFTEIGGKLQ